MENNSVNSREDTSKKPLGVVDKEERSFKEERVRTMSFMYYPIPSIKKAIFDFSKNRECVPRYFEGFGKRPDTFQYESDIIEFVKKGATSFHSSQELWKDPLEISTELSRKEFDELRIGWDLILDIDSPYLEYSKTYAEILINVLMEHGINNIGVKFSGGRGFHIIIPWKAFPKEIYNQKTKDMFPEWPRIICSYLLSKIKKKLDDEIYEKYEKGEGIQEIAKKMGKTESELVKITCKNCNRPSIKKELVTWICSNCRNELTMIRKTKRIPKCPNENCRTPLEESFSKPIDSCEFCNLDSKRNPEMFETIFKSSVEADLILVSPRHLFRMPYSLHEKTSLASVVIDKNEIKDFDIKKARPLNLKIKSFYPDSKQEEARELLLKALDWNEQKEKQEKIIKNTSLENQPLVKSKPTDFKKVVISNPSEEIFPPCIKSLLNGVKQDGRKRALFILINFFKSLGLSDVELEKKITTWNENNYQPLKNGYIQSQIIWFKRNSSMLPPNCDKPHYKDLGVCHPDELCKQIKNPVNYAMKKYFRK